MYPIDNFNVSSEDRLEAVKYYIDLNKYYLKEISKEGYERFAEFMKGAGKDIVIQISQEEDVNKVYALLEEMEKELPYGKTLIGKKYERKLDTLYRELAKDMPKNETYDRKACLKKQRELAELYDKAIVICGKYKDKVCNHRQIRETLLNPSAINRFCKNNPNDRDTIIKNLFGLERDAGLKAREARIKAFSVIRQYGIEDAIHQMEQEKLFPESNR